MIGTAWSLLPPIVAIALALKTKEVYSSLFIGIILGAVQYCISDVYKRQMDCNSLIYPSPKD